MGMMNGWGDMTVTDQDQLLREHVKLLKHIRLLLLVLTGSIVMPILIALATTAFGGYWVWSIL